MKVIPFAIFFSFFYVISKYEINNELVIYGILVYRKLTSKLFNYLFNFRNYYSIIYFILMVLKLKTYQDLL